MTRLSRSSVLVALGVGGVLACEESPPPQGPTQWTYQNGYAQQTSAQTPNPSGWQTAPTAGTVTYTPLPTGTTASPDPTVALAAPSVEPQVSPPLPQQLPQQIQTVPVPLGVQALPPPTSTTGVQTPPQTTAPQMAVPGRGAFVCSSDAQCLLGRCNTPYSKCAYPCRHSETDCKPGNVCTASGLCMPKGAAGVAM